MKLFFYQKENIEAFPLHQYGEDYLLAWVIQLLWNGAFSSTMTEINILSTCLILRKRSTEKRLGDQSNRIALRWFKEKLQAKISRPLSLMINLNYLSLNECLHYCTKN